MTRNFIYIILIIFIGCKDSKPPKSTYFGGKIINPKCSYVILSDNYNFNDTIYLKKDNSFIGNYKDLKEGLYFFTHGPEHQYIYLEPKDSLLFRLNTWDFDESLVFSGKNAERNNILIEAFLQTEQEDKYISKFYKLPQDEFLRKVDSLKEIRQKIIDNYKNKNNNISEKFKEILNVALLYPIYNYKEKYAIHNYAKETPEKLVDSYFNHRNNISAKKDSLIFYGPYYRFIKDKLYNDVYLKKLNSNPENFTADLLKNIDSEITSEEIKNKLLYNTMIRHFFEDPKNKNEAFFTFFKLNTDIDQKKNIQRLKNDLKVLNNGEKIPSFDLINARGEVKNISKIIKGKSTVLLFKNYRYASDEWVSSRINYLIKNNPNIKFVVVNLCSDFKRYTKNVDIKYQYTLPAKSAVCNFSSSKFPRMLLINKNGIIVNGYTSLSAKDINLQVNNLQKTK